MHIDPAAQTVEPVYEAFPPHCDHLGSPPVTEELGEVVDEVVEALEVVDVDEALDVVLKGLPELEEVPDASGP